MFTKKLFTAFAVGIVDSTLLSAGTVTGSDASCGAETGVAEKESPIQRIPAAQVLHPTIKIEGLDIFYREDAAKDAPGIRDEFMLKQDRQCKVVPEGRARRSRHQGAY